MKKTLTNEEFQKRLKNKNNGIYTEDDYLGLNTEICFYCSNGHQWKDIPKNILSRNHCPLCKGSKRVFKGINDLWTTHPNIASQLKNENNGYIYKAGSGVKVDWICPNCGHQGQAIISNVTKRGGYSCPICSDGISYPNKLMASILEYLKIDYVPEYTILGAKYRYDFYIPKFNAIIEMHGRQHYEGWSVKQIKLNEIQNNDLKKKNHALQNNIKYYIVIDCRKDYLDGIKKEIQENHEINKILPISNIDWNIVGKMALKSYIKLSAEMYNNGINLDDISKYFKRNRATINVWLQQASDLGFCNYIKAVGNRFENKSVILINTNEVFNSISEAGKKYNIGTGEISLCCKHISNYAGTLNNIPMVWRYLNDSDSNKEIDLDLLSKTKGRGKSINLYDLNNNFIQLFPLQKDAIHYLGYNNNHNKLLSDALKSNNHVAHGYKWYYASDPNQPDKSKIIA